MQRQTVCAFTDWLKGVHPDGSPLASPLGVNHFLPNIDRDPLDTAPPKAIAMIADPYRDNNVSDFGKRPAKLPAIYVLPDGPTVKEGEAGPVDRKALRVAIAVKVIVLDPNDAASIRYADYVQRAVEQSYAAFLAEDDQASVARTREHIRIVEGVTILQGPWRESVGEAMAVAATGLAFQCRDQQPRG